MDRKMDLHTDKQKNKKRNQEGFTLIEVIAVLVILGILAVVALPKFISVQDSARDKALTSAISELNAQVIMAFSNNRLSNGNPGEYDGYTGDIGLDFVLSGQAVNIPGPGTIKMADHLDTYTLSWTAGDSEIPGRFSLGPKV